MSHELKAKHIQTETLENKADDRIQARNILTYVQNFLSNLGENDLVPKSYVDLLFESVGIEKYKGSYETLSDAEFDITDPEIDDLIVIRGNKSIYWYDGSSWEPVGGSTETPATIKVKYESNEDTNAFTDAEKSKLAGIATGATKNANTDELSEGTTNKYFTEARAVASKLAGYVKAATVSAISSATSILEAIGILEKALDNKVDKVAGSGLITDAEKLIFADKYTKNETDNLISGAIASLIWKDDVAEFADLATEYPDAIEGWASVVNDENKIYRFDGTDWIPIGDITIPMATAYVDGKMSKEDFVKLRDIEAEATKNTNTDELDEGTTNKYFTDARAAAAKIAGYVKAGTPIPLAETDSILQALGKLEGLLDTKLSIRGDNFIFTRPTANKAANGVQLQNIIYALEGFTPGGQPLSNTNRAQVLVMPGEYSANLSLNSPYIDIIGFGSKNGIILNGNINAYGNEDHRIENLTVIGGIDCYSHTEVCVYRNLSVGAFWCDTLGTFENIEHSGAGDYLFESLSGGVLKNIYTPKALGSYASIDFEGIIEECRVEGQHEPIGVSGIITRSYFKGNNGYDAIFELYDGAEISYTTIINESDQETGTEWAVTNFKRYGAPDTDKDVRIHHCHFVAKDGALSPKVINTIENGHNTWDSEGEGDGIEDIIAGTNVFIDKTDPKNPIINSFGGGGGGGGYETPFEVRDALQSLTGANRLDASAIMNLPQGFSGSWNDLSDKPSLFPPAAHTHDISDVSGLLAALSGKVDKETGKGLFADADQLKIDAIDIDGDGTKFLTDDGTYKSELNPRTYIEESASGSVSIDLSNKDIVHIEMSGNITSFNVTNPVVGKTYKIYMIQDSVGNRTLTGLDPKFKTENDIPILLSTDQDAVDLLQLDVFSSTDIKIFPVYNI